METRYSEIPTKNGKIICGQDLICTVSTVLPSTPAGTSLWDQSLNPALMLKTRIAQFAPLFTKFTWNRLHFVYVPSAPTTQSGTLIHYINTDPDGELNDLPDQDPVQYIAAYSGQTPFAIWDYGTCELPKANNEDKNKLYYLQDTGDERFYQPGTYHLYTATDIPGPQPLGLLYAVYECALEIPALNPMQLFETYAYWPMVYESGDPTQVIGLLTDTVPEIGSAAAEIVPVSNQLTFKATGYWILSCAFTGTYSAFSGTRSPTTGIDFIRPFAGLILSNQLLGALIHVKEVNASILWTGTATSDLATDETSFLAVTYLGTGTVTAGLPRGGPRLLRSERSRRRYILSRQHDRTPRREVEDDGDECIEVAPKRDSRSPSVCVQKSTQKAHIHTYK